MPSGVLQESRTRILVRAARALGPGRPDGASAFAPPVGGRVSDRRAALRARQLLDKQPRLAQCFAGNGWDPVACGFIAAPDWRRARSRSAAPPRRTLAGMGPLARVAERGAPSESEAAGHH